MANLRRNILIAAVAGIAGAALVVASLLGLTSASAKLAAISTAVSAPDPDAVALAELGDQAAQRAREVAPDAVLRQVSLDPNRGRRFFHFTDAAATREITVIVPAPEAPSDQWEFHLPSLSKLTGHPQPGLNLHALQVGPTAAVQAITSQWEGCTPRGLGLVGKDDDLLWVAFCDLPDGRVASGTVDGRTGVFQPSPAPPAYPPSTATPIRQ